MESKPLKLAKKIALILKDEDVSDAVNALKIAKLMLPPAAVQRSNQKKKREAAEEKAESAGSLVPADEELMRFSKAMGQSAPVPAEVEEPPELQ